MSFIVDICEGHKYCRQCRGSARFRRARLRRYPELGVEDYECPEGKPIVADAVAHSRLWRATVGKCRHIIGRVRIKNCETCGEGYIYTCEYGGAKQPHECNAIDCERYEETCKPRTHNPPMEGPSHA